MSYNRPVLVTGGAGFVGACLVRRLVGMGFDVHVIVRESTNRWRLEGVRGSLTEHRLDLSEGAKVKGLVKKIKPGLVYHLAAHGGYPFQRDPHKMIGTNIVGTLNLLEACEDIGFDYFINTGSSLEYGHKPGPMKETDILEPAEFYGVTKASASLLCRSMARGKQLPVVTFRLFSVYGPYEEPCRLIPTVVRSCLLGKNLLLSSSGFVRDFIFINDVVDLYTGVIGRPFEPGDIFNVGFGKQYSVEDVVNKVIRLTGAEVKPVWGAVNRPLPEPQDWVADTAKIKNKLGWSPKYDLDQGLDETIAWFKANLNLYL